MTVNGENGTGEDISVHETVGAYVLGILDDAEATAFEAHLAECDLCAARLEEFAGMEPMLALLADGPGRFAEPGGSTVPEAPGQATTAAADPRQGWAQGESGTRAEEAGAGGAQAEPSGPAPAEAGEQDEEAASEPPRRPPLTAVPSLSQTPPEPVPAAAVRPSDQLLGRLVDEVSVQRAKRRRRNIFMIAAAAVLIVGGPSVAVVATSDSGASSTVAEAPSGDAYLHQMKNKVTATDPVTKVSATVGVESKAWGTNAVMELKNVKGPLTCSLVAVSSTGARQTMTTWSVPAWGYGIKDSPHVVAREPLYVQGGSSLQPKDIDHFDVLTSTGKRLVSIPA